MPTLPIGPLMAAATGSEIPVEAPRLEAPVTGLLAQLPVIDGPEADRWLRGMAFSPESAGTLEFGELCVAEDLLGTAQRLANRAVHPFKLSLHDRCSTWGWRENEYVERVTRALAVKRHWAVDREFEKGALIPDNLHLADTYAGQPDPTTVTLAGGAVVSPTNALALLDEAIGNSANVIGRGVIWATPFVATQWRHAGLLTYEEVDDDAGVGRRATILSPAGNYVVIGNGFEGRSPAGTVPAAHASQWAYATDPVVVVAGDPETTPGTMAEATHFGTNTVVFRQEQWFAVLWAGLLNAAVQVATDTPTVTAGAPTTVSGDVNVTDRAARLVGRVTVDSTGTDTTASATAASNTATSASLPAVAGKTTYITGFSVTVNTGTAGPSGLVTITGTVGGTLNYQLAGGTTGVQLHIDFSRPVPASAVNTAITVNVPALGATTGAVAVTARGFQL